MHELVATYMHDKNQTTNQLDSQLTRIHYHISRIHAIFLNVLSEDKLTQMACINFKHHFDEDLTRAAALRNLENYV
ncbi:hypothetical protein Hanom_Chr13g01222551 [Helianthus anomalus]